VWKIPDRESEEIFSSSGRGRRKGLVSGRAPRVRLRQVVSEPRKASLLSVAEEKENSPFCQGEGVDNHPIQRRKGKRPEKEVGKCRIQTWRGKCEIFVPEWRTWR
jgi:hypothetical protein